MERRLRFNSGIVSHQMRQVYDQMASRFATIHPNMPIDLISFATDFLDFVGDRLILDLGCGSGRDMAWFTAQNRQIIGADLSAGMLIEARRQTNNPLLQMDMCRPAFVPQSFQGIWCNAALLHLPKQVVPQTLSLIHRLLSPDGILFLTLQYGSGEGWEAWQHDKSFERFFARYQPSEAVAILTQGGFVIEKQSTQPSNNPIWLHFLATARSIRSGLVCRG